MPFKSKKQQRFMFSAEARGELPKGTAKRWAKHTPDIKSLPEKAPSLDKKAFTAAFSKVAVTNMSEDARQESLRPFQERVPGSNLPKDTAQARGRATRTTDVQNEGKQFKPALHHVWENARQQARNKE